MLFLPGTCELIAHIQSIKNAVAMYCAKYGNGDRAFGTKVLSEISNSPNEEIFFFEVTFLSSLELTLMKFACTSSINVTAMHIRNLFLNSVRMNLR